ncbi:MFS transporter [Brucella pseudogrignonensis]|uniref:MFS transporter n=1 Tax=Brucella pseudogrignonensis TaxID=419475 RepID=UPI00124EC8CA|nr:MFS transporter [Brucella pseudogrignonensis]KAB2689198.1 MFS transporter [Brucella pseudogrignonensis]
MHHTESSPSPDIGHSGWTSVQAVALAIFAVVTTEMLPVGLMTPIAESFQVSVGMAGLTISLPAIVAALFAPLIIVLAGGIDRRTILAGLLTLLVVANLMTMFAATFSWLVAGRILVGFCMGGIWAIAGGLAPRLLARRATRAAAHPATGQATHQATHQAIARATAIIFGGVAAASVLGVPLGAFIDSFFGWRAAFGAMAGFTLIVLALTLCTLPSLPIDEAVEPARFQAALRHPLVLPGLVITLLLVAGHFMAYTFVTPILLRLSHVPASAISLFLFLYGTAGIVGNFLAGLTTARHGTSVLLCIAATLAATLLGFAFCASIPLNAIVLLTLWGLAYGGVSVALQNWMMKAAPSAIEVVTALFVSVFNIAIAAGSFIGGRIVDRFDLQSNLIAAAELATLAFITILLSTLRQRHRHAR